MADVRFSRWLLSKKISFSILLINLYLLHVIFAFKDGGLGDHELFKISWKGPLKGDENFDESNVINISTDTNDKYKCVVPDHGSIIDYASKNTSSDDDINPTTDEKTKKDLNPIQLLKPLFESNYCSYKYELYWVYELCHGKFLRQYHEEGPKYKSKISQEYYLGRMEPEQISAHEEEYLKMQDGGTTPQDPPTILVEGHHKPYITMNMTAGTICDLTKRSRAARIIYACNEEHKHELHSIKEISTCEYEAIVLSPLLCKHKDFKVDTSTQHEIRCYSIDDAPTRPAKTLVPEDDEILKDSIDRRRVIHLDHEIFYLVNLIQT